MNEREKLEMVKMCVDALLEGKSLEIFSCGSWQKSSNILDDVLRCILIDGTKCRIAKPTVKVRYRMYKRLFEDRTIIGILRDDENTELFKKAREFGGWLGDWQEVEIEE